MPQSIIPGRTYRYYKNIIVRVIGVALHSETLEELVLYEKLHDAGEYKKGSLWARPKKMFLEEVTINGQQRPSFSLIEN